MKKFLLAVFAILVVAGCNTPNYIPEPRRDDSDPSLRRLMVYLGGDRDAMKSKLEKRYGVIQKKFGKSGRFYNKTHSFTYFYDGKKLTKLILQIQQPLPYLKPYTGKLPAGLLRRDTYDSVVKKLGEPSSTLNNKTIIKYDSKGLTIHFANRTISTVTLTK